MIRRLLRRLAEWVTSDPSPPSDEVPVLLAPGRYVPRCEIDAACDPGDHTYSWPCEFEWGKDPWRPAPWDSDDLPSTADPGVVTDPKED
jgi:hypothetical protein